MMKTNILPNKEKSYSTPSTEINELLLKIHTATGWRLPKTEQLCLILCRQIENKLRFDYPGITPDQVETAFLKFGSEENFTGTLCIAQIDKVLRKYFAHQTQENFDKERRLTTQTIPIPTPEQHLNECRALIEHKYQLYLENKLSIELLPVFIWPVLLKDFKQYIDPNLPGCFILEAKQFIHSRNESDKFRRGVPIDEIMQKMEPANVKNTASKLALEYCFENFRSWNMKHLYEKSQNR